MLDLLAPKGWREQGRLDAPPPRVHAPAGDRRKRRLTPIFERARRAGVQEDLAPIPDDGDVADRRKIQKQNLQIVARAEQRAQAERQIVSKSPAAREMR